MGSITARWKVEKAEFKEMMQGLVRSGMTMADASMVALLTEVRDSLENQEKLLARLVELAEGDYSDDEERLPRSLGER